MKSPIRLERTVPVQAWRVKATIALARKREWEPAVLALAKERGALTPELVVEEMLGGRRGVARRLLDICERLGLFEERHGEWRLTGEGRIAAETGEIFAPELGLWTIWLAEDPLLPHPVLAVSRWEEEPSAYDERRGDRKDQGRSITALPGSLKGVVGRLLDIPSGKLRSLRMEDLHEARGERVESPGRVRLTWTIAPDGARCRLTGNEGVPVDADLPAPAWTHEEAWESILRHAKLESQWDPRRRTLSVPFRGTSDEERSRLVRTLRVARPAFEDLGIFDDTKIDGVGLFPQATGDAVEWARWRLFRALNSYADDATIREAFRQAAEPFEGMAGPCPSRTDLARIARGEGPPPPSYWWLTAPHDWSFETRRNQ